MATKSSQFEGRKDNNEGSRGATGAPESPSKPDDRTSAVQKGEGGQKTAEGGARKPGAQRGSIKSEANREKVDAERAKGLKRTPEE